MEELIEYYCNLLIMQYKNKPKARATIMALVNGVFAEGYEVAEGYHYTDNIIASLVENAYDLDSASGIQLSVVGKYLGYSRTLDFINEDIFQYCEYDDHIIPPYGYSEYFEEVNSYPYLEYNSIVKTGFDISDELYRKVLQFLALMKNKTLSAYDIDSTLYEIFGDDIYVEEETKKLVYYINQDILPAQIYSNADHLEVFIRKYFPIPMGCAIEINMFVSEESSSSSI